MLFMKKKKVISAGSLVLTILYPCLFMYFQNVDQGKFAEIIPAVCKLGAVAIVVLLFSWFLLKEATKTFLYADLVMFEVINFNTVYSFLKKGFPALRTIIYSCGVAILFLVILWIMKKKAFDGLNACKIIAIVFGILICVNFITAVPGLIHKIVPASTGNDAALADVKFKGEKPNVYYFIYDEYGGVENLIHYYDFDNKQMIEKLSDENVNVSSSSRNEESIYTSTIVPNLLNLSYVASDEDYSIDNIEKTENCILYQLFRNNGYSVNMIDHLGFLKSEGCHLLNTDLKGDTISTYIINNSLIKQLDTVIERVKSKVNGGGMTYVGRTRNILQLIEESSDYVQHDQPTFTIGYIQSPHDPIMFNEDGTVLPEDQWHNWANKELYIGQLKYINQNIEKAIENIKKNDPDALIIIQSDHGSRYPHWMVEDYGAEPYDENIEDYYMQNILNCVYYKGEQIDIEGLSGVNTLRTTFNYVFGTQYDMITTPEM